MTDAALPCELAPRLLAQAQEIRPDLPAAVVLAHCEFEAWFIAASASLAGRGALRMRIDDPRPPESIRGAKDLLRAYMHENYYSERVDQPRLAQLMNLEEARAAAPSFDKLCRVLEDFRRGRLKHL